MKRKAKPFGFDTFFDEEIIKRLREEEEARRLAEEEAAENRPPTFTEEELATAQEQSHAQGRQEGMADAMASVEQQVALTLDAIFNRMGGLIEDQKQWAQETHHDALLLAATIMRKIAPELTRGTELPQIEHVINEAFSFLTEQPKVMIRVAAEFEAPLKDKVHLMASRVGYEGQVVLVGDPELAATDCRVSWAAGAVERSLDEVWNQIDDVVERTLKALPPRSRQFTDVAEEAVATPSETAVPTVDDAPAVEDAPQEDAPAGSVAHGEADTPQVEEPAPEMAESAAT